MFRNVFLKNLRDQRRALVGWVIGVVAVVGLMAAVFPVMRDMGEFDQLLAAYPEAFRELFDIDAMTTGAGFMNAELFSIVLPALFIVFGIGRGARAIAGEEEAGTLEVLLVTPLSPIRLVLQQAAALAVALLALGGALFVSLIVSSLAFDMDLGAADAAVASLAMVLLGIEHGFLALAVGTATGRKGLAVSVAAIVAFAGYLLYVAGELVESLLPWQPASPFHQALQNGPLGGEPPLGLLWMALAAVVFVLAALPVFDRRDLATG